MGVFKKMLGGMSAPVQEQVAPAPQAVTTDTNVDTDMTTKKKKKSGFSSTQSSMLDAGGEGRTTLG